jgi:hypothetical protein
VNGTFVVNDFNVLKNVVPTTQFETKADPMPTSDKELRIQ